jgi:hypothetical protein
MKGKLLLMSALAATVWGLLYFRGDIQRYAKMKMM